MLILLPTALELRLAFPEMAARVAPGAAPVAWRSTTRLGEAAWIAACGMGLSAAGARAAAAWSAVSGDACLCGLGGSLDPASAPGGSVVMASRVDVEGIGFGSEEAFMHPSGARGDLLAEWQAQAPAAPWTPAIPVPAVPFLSVASASGDARHAELRRRRHPGAAVEEMEGDAVLHAAAALGRRLVILRGISNEAGQRDPSAWRSAEAMAALRAVLDAWLAP